MNDCEGMMKYFNEKSCNAKIFHEQVVVALRVEYINIEKSKICEKVNSNLMGITLVIRRRTLFPRAHTLKVFQCIFRTPCLQYLLS